MPVGGVAVASTALPKTEISFVPATVAVTVGAVSLVPALVVTWPPWTSTGVVGSTPLYAAMPAELAVLDFVNVNT